MVFAQIFRWVAFLSLTGGVGACAPYRNMSVEVLRPAQVSVDRAGRVGVLDRNMAYRTTPIRFKDEEGARMELAEQFAAGMQDVMQAAGREDSLACWRESRMDTLAAPELPMPLARDSVDAFCRNHGVDYVVALEMCWWEVRKEEMFYNGLVRLYTAGGEVPPDSVRFALEMGNVHDLEYYEDLYGFLKSAVREQGRVYAERIVPHWEICERRIYNRGRILRLGDAYYRDGKEEEALKVWEAALRLSGKTAVRAAMNVAWMYEKAGEYDEAAALLTKLRGVKPKEAEYLAEYLEVLAGRMREKIVLDEQFGHI